MKDIFNFTLVKADYRASEESEDSRNSILGSIIGRTVDRSAADERIQELYSGIEEQRKRIYDEIYGKKLDDLSCKLNSIIEGYSVGRTVSVISETQEIKPPKQILAFVRMMVKMKRKLRNKGMDFNVCF